MPTGWPSLSYGEWSATCDTLHAHTQVPLAPSAARWEPALGEYVLDWDDVGSSPDPHAAALEFARSAFRHACEVCEWDPALAGSADGTPPPVV